MRIRKTDYRDIDALTRIYSAARQYMTETGNPAQWGGSYPSEELILTDIERERSYVGVTEDGEIHMTFVFQIGEDATYRIIENGSWMSDEPYGVIHRLASDGRVKGAFAECLAFCEKRADNIRVDTHENNATMRYLLSKNGFSLRGIIYTDRGTPRIAYQRIRS